MYPSLPAIVLAYRQYAPEHHRAAVGCRRGENVTGALPDCPSICPRALSEAAASGLFPRSSKPQLHDPLTPFLSSPSGGATAVRSRCRGAAAAPGDADPCKSDSTQHNATSHKGTSRHMPVGPRTCETALPHNHLNIQQSCRKGVPAGQDVSPQRRTDGRHMVLRSTILINHSITDYTAAGTHHGAATAWALPSQVAVTSGVYITSMGPLPGALTPLHDAPVSDVSRGLTPPRAPRKKEYHPKTPAGHWTGLQKVRNLHHLINRGVPWSTAMAR